jgi:hypothetical protein
MKPLLIVSIVLLVSFTAQGRPGVQGGTNSRLTIRKIGPAQTANTPAADTDVFAVMVPFKEVFVIREGDPTGLGFIAQCRAGNAHDGRIEILEGPSFVGLSIVGTGRTVNGESLGVGIISPLRGDAGTYSVKVSLGSCDGGKEKILSFKVKVKKARDE